MEIRQDCNKCKVDNCRVTRSPLSIISERAQELSCFIYNSKIFKLKDCISKITISNSQSEVVRWFMNHA